MLRLDHPQRHNPRRVNAGTNAASSSGSSTPTEMSTIGFAARPGTDVEPTCSIRRARRTQRRGDPRPLGLEPRRPRLVVVDDANIGRVRLTEHRQPVDRTRRATPAATARRQHPHHVTRRATGSCTCPAAAPLATRRRPAAASSRPPHRARRPARPHGCDTRRSVINDTVTSSSINRSRSIPSPPAASPAPPLNRAATGSATPASGTPAPTPRSACSACWSCAGVARPVMPGRVDATASRRPAALPAADRLVVHPLAVVPPTRTLFIVPCDAGADSIGHRRRERAQGTRRRCAG